MINITLKFSMKSQPSCSMCLKKHLLCKNWTIQTTLLQSLRKKKTDSPKHFEDKFPKLMHEIFSSHMFLVGKFLSAAVKLLISFPYKRTSNVFISFCGGKCCLLYFAYLYLTLETAAQVTWSDVTNSGKDYAGGAAWVCACTPELLLKNKTSYRLMACHHVNNQNKVSDG